MDFVRQIARIVTVLPKARSSVKGRWRRFKQMTVYEKSTWAGQKSLTREKREHGERTGIERPTSDAGA